MKLYFKSRSLARNFKNASKRAVRVIDSKENPSRAGSRWAVELKTK